MYLKKKKNISKYVPISDFFLNLKKKEQKTKNERVMLSNAPLDINFTLAYLETYTMIPNSKFTQI